MHAQGPVRAAGAQIMFNSPPSMSWRLDMQDNMGDPHHRMMKLEDDIRQMKAASGYQQAPQGYDAGPGGMYDPMAMSGRMPGMSTSQMGFRQTTQDGFMSAHHQMAAFTPPPKRLQDHYDPAGMSTGLADTPLVSTGMATTPGSSVADPHFVVSYQDYQMLHQMHKDVVNKLAEAQTMHHSLLQKHHDLMMAHAETLNYASDLTQKINEIPAAGAIAEKEKPKKKHPCLGVIRLDYNYPPGAGDIDSPGSFGFDVTYRVIPGLTFEMAQKGQFTEQVERRFAEGIKFLENKGVNAITGDCGFMMAFQILARKIAAQPVFMSSMVQCPIISAAFDEGDRILVLTANEHTLKPQKDVLMNTCGFDVDEDRFIIKGCQDLPGFDAVARGEEVPLDVVQPAIVKMTMDILHKDKTIRAILLECTELPPYADALRAATDLPVFDAITAADFYISGYKDNPRFGIDDWQAEFHEEDRKDYKFGENLISDDQKKVLAQGPGKVAAVKAKAKSKAALKKVKKAVAKAKAPVLGVLRLDYNYPPSAGDIDHAGSYDYDVIFRMVPGLSFEMAQSGRMTYTVQQQFVQAIKWLENQGACGITGDCGFMMAFQPLARDVANIPVFMSSMMQSPMISVAFDKYDKVLVLTANSKTLEPQKEVLLSQCGFDVDDDRFIIQGCQDVPGFDEVAKGGKVDVEKVTPGIVKLTQDLLEKSPNIRAILLECTELPPYSDALRCHTGLPVWDAITCADYFVSCRKDNPRFGLNQWQNDWDGTVEEYKLGQNLTEKQRKMASYA